MVLYSYSGLDFGLKPHPLLRLHRTPVRFQLRLMSHMPTITTRPSTVSFPYLTRAKGPRLFQTIGLPYIIRWDLVISFVTSEKWARRTGVWA